MKRSGFYFESCQGSLKDGKRRSDFTQALHRLLDKYCGTAWEYKYVNDGSDSLWGE